MDAFALNLIEALGGSTAVSRLTVAPLSTVQSWKKNGIPASRLAHLQLVAEKEGVSIDWETGVRLSDHDGSDTAAAQHASHGKGGEVSASQVAA